MTASKRALALALALMALLAAFPAFSEEAEDEEQAFGWLKKAAGSLVSVPQKIWQKFIEFDDYLERKAEEQRFRDSGGVRGRASSTDPKAERNPEPMEEPVEEALRQMLRTESILDFGIDLLQSIGI